MKKLVLVIALVAIMATGTAFAEHPDGWGVGIVGSFGGSWEFSGFDAGSAYTYGLSLKAPQLPVFWGIGARFGSYGQYLRVTGDYYLYDSTLVSDIGLGWYLGVGGFVDLNFGGGYTGFDLGVRVPIGLSFQPPAVDILEIFLDVAPSLGVAIAPDFHFPAGGWPVELGVRFWF